MLHLNVNRGLIIEGQICGILYYCWFMI